MIDRLLRFCIHHRGAVVTAAFLIGLWGLISAPFDWRLPGFPRNPVPVDAIPDIGENQQIVFTEWPGRSPRDVEDQITYPLTTALLGVPRVKAVRGFSMFGFSNIYIIFEEGVDFYWSRSRVLEKLNSLPPETLPADVRPRLGPDATALGQIFWYTLEGRDENGLAAGGWDLHELRSIQDWQVRFALMAAEGVSEVASVGGFVREYQIDVDPDRMRAFGVSLREVAEAVRRSNIDVGARTIEVNRVEYVIRGLGFVETPEDLRDALIKMVDGNPVFVRHVAEVAQGPAMRRGALDKNGQPAVGGVVVARYGANPLAVIENVRRKIAEIAPGLPSKTLPDGTVSRVTVVPFYDRSGLIHETLGTLRKAIIDEVLITLIVVVLFVMHLGGALLVASVLPLSVLVCFIAMKGFGVDANVVALSGIAIAIGTLTDLGIIVCENILARQSKAPVDKGEWLETVLSGAREVGGAVFTAAATTIVSFLPVFALQGPEGKLFRPLAFTKTFSLAAAALIALTVIPALAAIFLSPRRNPKRRRLFSEGLLWAGAALAFLVNRWTGALVFLIGLGRLAATFLPTRHRAAFRTIGSLSAAAGLVFVLSRHWRPLGFQQDAAANFLFTALAVTALMLFFYVVYRSYTRLLAWCLDHKKAFLSLPAVVVLFGVMAWQGFGPFYRWLPTFAAESAPARLLADAFPGLSREFLPDLDEGAFLYMPVTMPHAGMSEVLDILETQDRALGAIPEVVSAVGKLGRADSALDPAPLSMIETLITYRDEFLSGPDGQPERFRFDAGGVDLFRSPSGVPLPAGDGRPYSVPGRFARDENGRLIPDPSGRPFRQWRPPLVPSLNPGRPFWPGIRHPDDIWDLILSAAVLPGVTRAPRLQPISARLVMLQSGIRAAMGVRVTGPDLASIETLTARIEALLRETPAVAPHSVVADRLMGKPYLEIDIDRRAIARHGIDLKGLQDALEMALGGIGITRTVEGRERYPVRIRYPRELRDRIEDLGRILIPSPAGPDIPLMQLAHIRYIRGPEVIRSEDSFPVGYVLFDRREGHAEVETVEQARNYLRFKMESGDLILPPGTTFSFTGRFEDHLRSRERLRILLPLSLILIFGLLYFRFHRITTTVWVFCAVFVAWAGGFILIWLYGQPWFLNVDMFGLNLREIFQVRPVHLSVAVWVGFLALFGIATDDNVVMAAYLDQHFSHRPPDSVEEIRIRTIAAGQRRIRPCLMTTATTLLALLPVLTAAGRGSGIMIPMAIPVFGGLVFEVVTMFVLPVLYALEQESRLKATEGR